MTGQEMVDLLGLRLEDTAEANFTSATKLKALNVAQTTVANFLDKSYLIELDGYASHILNSGQTTNGSIPLSAMTVAPLRNMVRAVEVKYSGDYKFVIMIPFEDAKTIENQYLAPSEDSPVAWIFNNTLEVRPTGLTNLKIYYLKSPTDITASSTVPDLNVSLHETVLDFAEAQLWRMDNKVDRANIAQNMAMNTIKILNDRFTVEAPTGIGTKSKGSN